MKSLALNLLNDNLSEARNQAKNKSFKAIMMDFKNTLDTVLKRLIERLIILQLEIIIRLIAIRQIVNNILDFSLASSSI